MNIDAMLLDAWPRAHARRAPSRLSCSRLALICVAGSPSAARDPLEPRSAYLLASTSRAAPLPTHQEPQMHSLNHAVLGHAVADERAGRPMVRAVRSRGAPSARPVPRCAAAPPSRPAAWRAGWTARWRAAPSSDPCVGGVAPRPRRYPRAPWNSVRLEDRESFITADGSSIRELAGIPSGNASTSRSPRRPSRPAARPSSTSTAPPRRSTTSSPGAGRMRLGDEEADVRAGDTVVIAPGLKHKLFNPGAEPLVLLCCCAPAVLRRGHRPAVRASWQRARAARRAGRSRAAADRHGRGHLAAAARSSAARVTRLLADRPTPAAREQRLRRAARSSRWRDAGGRAGDAARSTSRRSTLGEDDARRRPKRSGARRSTTRSIIAAVVDANLLDASPLFNAAGVPAGSQPRVIRGLHHDSEPAARRGARRCIR